VFTIGESYEEVVYLIKDTFDFL